MADKKVVTDVPIILEVNVVQELRPDLRIGMGEWVQIRHVRVDITGGAVPTDQEMQRISYAAKMEYARQIRRRKKI